MDSIGFFAPSPFFISRKIPMDSIGFTRPPINSVKRPRGRAIENPVHFSLLSSLSKQQTTSTSNNQQTTTPANVQQPTTSNNKQPAINNKQPTTSNKQQATINNHQQQLT